MKTHDTQRRAGEEHPKARVPDTTVNAMRDELDSGLYTMRDIAERHRVPWSTAWDILTYRTRILTRPNL